MAMLFSKYLSSSLTSPILHHLPAATFPHITFLKLSLLSTSVAANKDTPASNLQPEISEFLLKECGLCQSELLVIIRRWATLMKCRSAHTAREAVKFLRDSGVPEEQVRKIIRRTPCVLFLKTDRQLKPKIELLKRLGITGKDLGNLVTQGGRFLGSNLDKTLSPNIQYLQKLFGSIAIDSKAWIRASRLLSYRDGPEIWENKLSYLASFGLLEDEIKKLVKKFPEVLSLSTDKMQKNMDFLRYTAQLPANIVLTDTRLILYSVECRMKPRHEVLMFIGAMQPAKCLPSFTSALCLSEKEFLDKYVKCSSHAAELFEIYSGKSIHLDIPL